VRKILIVGGGLAAARTCASLRRLGFDGAITVLAGEDRLPYDRPPLSKAALHGETDTTLPVAYADLEVTVRLGTRATALDARRRLVTTQSGATESFDGLVIACGAEPIVLPGAGRQATLRTAADAAGLRARLVPGAHVLIIGASWIGAEVATAALARGCQVTCVEAAQSPLAGALGTAAGAALAGWWSGVDLRLAIGVAGVSDDGARLADGSVLPADVVVTGIGVRPATRWLEGSGLELERGVLVDEYLRASLPNVVAVGDAACWWSRRWHEHMRLGHWDDAAQAPAVAARSLLEPGAHQAPYDPVPYFWSDQFGRKLQFVGHRTADCRELVLAADDGALRGIAWLRPDGRLTAYLALDSPRDMLRARKAIADGAAPSEALLDGAALTDAR
jgi:3-phenylpropionate/trans-cinnamate dioxygenase ferredoxin reductase component